MRSREPDLLVEGPLADYAEGYEQRLRRLGYYGRHLCRHVALLSELNEWMKQRGLAVGQLSSEQLEAFFAERRRRGCGSLVTTRCVASVL